jgi:hypothetical protein
MADIHTGRCACGAVSYEVRGPLRSVSFCHCESCRRQSSNFVSATAAPVDNLRITGAENLSDWQATPDAVRQFCKTCGSLMFWRWNGASKISIMAGSMDQPTGLDAAMHIYVAEKGDYYDIADGLPQFDIRPPKT